LVPRQTVISEEQRHTVSFSMTTVGLEKTLSSVHAHGGSLFVSS
jgi:hypothetical protein